MKLQENFILKGDIAFNRTKTQLETVKDGYLVCMQGICKGVFQEIPKAYEDFPVKDYSGRLIIPAMSDLHVHASQYTYRGTNMDLELLEWLNQYTFPEEAEYQRVEYAKEAYSYFVEDLRRSFTSRAVIFATIHNEATIELMDQLEKTGLICYVGRLNMDRNSVPQLQEESAEASIKGTESWLDAVAGKYERIMPILTPRFIPSCTDALMNGLGQLCEKRGVRLQSHLSENKSEIAWVRELVPQADCYANAYEIFGTMGTADRPTVMSHCVYSDEREMEILKAHGTFVAHCPSSNMNVSTGIAPVRKLISAGIPVGLGTDVAGGSSLNMLQTMLNAIQVSKLYYRLEDSSAAPLTLEEAFYMATVGGGSYFGKVGTFLEGYEFDALVLDDSMMRTAKEISILQRVERACYNDRDIQIREKFVRGKTVFTGA